MFPSQPVNFAPAQPGPEGEQENFELFRLRLFQFRVRLGRQQRGVHLGLVTGARTFAQVHAIKRQGLRQDKAKIADDLWTEKRLGAADDAGGGLLGAAALQRLAVLF